MTGQLDWTYVCEGQDRTRTNLCLQFWFLAVCPRSHSLQSRLASLLSSSPAMSPKPGEKVKGGAAKGGAAKEGVVKEPTKRAAAVGQNASTLKGKALDAMPERDLKEMVGWMKYHGEQKKVPDSHVAQAMAKFNAGSPEEKRKILQSFKGPNGKSLKWAKELVVATKTTDADIDSTKSGMMTRPAGNKYVRTASFRGGGPHVLIKHLFFFNGCLGIFLCRIRE